MQTRNSLCSLATPLAAQGWCGEALAAFDAANAIERRIDLEANELYSDRGIQWARLLIRLGKTQRADEITQGNILICEQQVWQDDLARCHILLGMLDTQAGRFLEAGRRLAQVESLFRRAHLIVDLSNTLLARAKLEHCQEHWEDALSTVDAALRLAAPRGMRLLQADALVLRGHIRLARACAADRTKTKQEIERAGDDLDQALTLARTCGYAWAERDALTHLAEVRSQLGDRERATALGREADRLSHRLLDTTPPDPNPFAWAYEGDAPVRPPARRARRKRS